MIDIGQTDEWGYTLLDNKGPVELYQTPREYYVVYLWVTNDDYLSVVRKYRQDAELLFDSVCNMLPPQ